MEIQYRATSHTKDKEVMASKQKEERKENHTNRSLGKGSWIENNYHSRQVVLAIKQATKSTNARFLIRQIFKGVEDTNNHFGSN